LEAVLAEVDADAIVFGGDYLYGPYPRETVAIVRSLDAQVLRGNCEDLAEEWERGELAEGDLEWLQARPLSATVDGVLYCHAAPGDNTPDRKGTRLNSSHELISYAVCCSKKKLWLSPPVYPFLPLKPGTLNARFLSIGF